MDTDTMSEERFALEDGEVDWLDAEASRAPIARLESRDDGLYERRVIAAEKQADALQRLAVVFEFMAER
jgi:hypothetical protein